MKLANVTEGLARLTAKVEGMKLNAVKVLAAAPLAGGLLVAAAPAAQAQRFAVGYRGGPRVFYGGPRVVVAPPVVCVWCAVLCGSGVWTYVWRRVLWPRRVWLGT